MAFKGCINTCENCRKINLNRHIPTMCRGYQLFAEEEQGIKVMRDADGTVTIQRATEYNQYITMNGRSSLLP